MLGTDGDLVARGPYHLPVFPLLLAGDESSLDEDVVHEDVHHNVMTCIDHHRHFLATTDDVTHIEQQPCFGAEAHHLRFLFGNSFFSLPGTEEVFLDLSNDHRFGGAVESSMFSL